MDTPRGPDARIYAGQDPSNSIYDLGFKYLEMVYLPPAENVWEAIKDRQNMTAREIIDVIMQKTHSIQQTDEQHPHDLFNELKTPEMKVAIVYGYLLSKIIPQGEEAHFKEIKDGVFEEARLQFVPYDLAREYFNRY